MQRYISLLNMTEQGIRDARSIPQRIAAAEQAFQQAGAKLVELYMVTGVYDYVLVMDAPDDETMAKVMLALGMKGNVRSQTFRAFDREQIGRLIGGLA